MRSIGNLKTHDTLVKRPVHGSILPSSTFPRPQLLSLSPPSLGPGENRTRGNGLSLKKVPCPQLRWIPTHPGVVLGKDVLTAFGVVRERSGPSAAGQPANSTSDFFRKIWNRSGDGGATGEVLHQRTGNLAPPGRSRGKARPGGRKCRCDPGQSGRCNKLTTSGTPSSGSNERFRRSGLTTL